MATKPKAPETTEEAPEGTPAPNLTLNQTTEKRKNDAYDSINTAPNMTLGVAGMKLTRPAKVQEPDQEPPNEPPQDPAE